MLCRTSILKEVGGFDPRFFLFKDVDLSRKVQAKGFKTLYYPFVTVTHHWDRAPYSSTKMTLVMIWNGIKYFNKWGWKFQ
ncbi:glycosyltransferase [Geobacter sp. DSM 9736]|uniref:glycosyltransferase family 2 protein n=1 Tax=Geobacter sp. DSM 9736 TaxID=1277350 RepID=UPI000B4FD66C